MISKPKTRISENLSGLQQNDISTEGLQDEFIAEGQSIAVDSASVIPLPNTRFIYAITHPLQQPANLKGLIIGHHHPCQNSEQKKRGQDAGKYRILLTTKMTQQYPKVPVIKSAQLGDSAQRENLIVCMSALNELNQLKAQKLTRHALIDFHSRYKLVLLAHNQPRYREIGRFVAQLHQWKDLDAFFIAYRKKLMAILQQPASCKNHVNVIMHIQGYFNRQETPQQRSELCQVIHDYRQGTRPLSDPLTLLKKYLAEYPNNYLLKQKYFMLYPNNTLVTKAQEAHKQQ